MVYILACLIGFIAGLRTTIAPAAVSLGAHLGMLHFENTAFAFFGYPATLYILVFLVIVELIVDQLPATPSRKVPIQFMGRIVMGALCGAAISIAMGHPLLSIGGLAGGVVGIVGAVLGTFGGFALRTHLARAFGRDLPAALIEDVIAILGATLILIALA